MKSISTYAPGRAELLGNHTDYNEGYVLAIAVNCGTTLTGTAREDRVLSLRSRELGKSVEIPLDQLAAEKVADWSRYTLGVVDVFRRQGLAVGGFDAEITSTLPMGAGLSSSASLENAAVLFLLKAFGGSLPPVADGAKFSQMAEHDFVGVRCGLLDQIASLMSHAAHATFIDCRTFDVRHLPLSDRVSFVLAQGREASAGRRRVQRAALGLRGRGPRARREGAARRDHRNAAGAPARDARPHFPSARGTSPARTSACWPGSDLLERGDLAGFGQLMFESHESSRVYFENSCAGAGSTGRGRAPDPGRLRRAAERRRFRRSDDQSGGARPGRGSCESAHRAVAGTNCLITRPKRARWTARGRFLVAAVYDRRR